VLELAVRDFLGEEERFREEEEGVFRYSRARRITRSTWRSVPFEERAMVGVAGVVCRVVG